MAFQYIENPAPHVLTPPSKSVHCKAFRINVAEGDGFLNGTTYPLGKLNKSAQIVYANAITRTAVSGGTVSAATLNVSLDGQPLVFALNVFGQNLSGLNAVNYFTNYDNNGPATTDQVVSYTPTLTGAGATAGIIYINIFYVD